MKYLMKFGGTSVADARCIGLVVDILEKHHKAGDKLAVVVSAQRGVTDQLIDIAEKLPTAQNCAAVPPLIEALRKRHMTTLEGAAPDYAKEVGAVIEKRLASLQHILFAIYNLRELTPRSKDYVISYGERLLAPIVGAAILLLTVILVIIIIKMKERDLLLQSFYYSLPAFVIMKAVGLGLMMFGEARFRVFGIPASDVAGTEDLIPAILDGAFFRFLAIAEIAWSLVMLGLIYYLILNLSGRKTTFRR